MFETPDGPEGCIQGPIWGTSWHGIFESDAFRKAMISWVAGANGRDWSPGEFSFPAAREAQATLLGVLVSEHLDCDGLMSLARNGAPQNLPVIAPAGVP